MTEQRSPQVLVAGYASIDQALSASRHAVGGETAILRGPVHPPTTHGGCARNAAMVLTEMGIPVGLITWVGDDAEGTAYVAELSAAGVDVTSVVRGASRSPRSLLVYDPRGTAACYFHPSESSSQQLTAALRAQLEVVEWLAITVGPASVTRALLGAVPDGVRLAWNVKGDADAFPRDLVERLLRADLVCLNEAELEFVARQLADGTDPTPEALVSKGAGCVALTLGRRGYRIVTIEESFEAPVEPVEVRDPTGAGDAFFAALLAGRMRGMPPPEMDASSTSR